MKETTKLFQVLVVGGAILGTMVATFAISKRASGQMSQAADAGKHGKHGGHDGGGGGVRGW